MLLCFCARKCRAWYYLTATTTASIFTPRLNGRTQNRAIGAIDTAAVTGFRLKHSMTLLAFVEPLTRIRGHGFRVGVAANWAS